MNDVVLIRRTERGTFAPGQSGNVTGRSKAAQLVRQRLEEHAQEIVDQLLDLIRQGDVRAIRLALERLCPPLPPQNEQLDELLRRLRRLEGDDDSIDPTE